MCKGICTSFSYIIIYDSREVRSVDFKIHIERKNVDMANTNRVQNAGFEQSTVPSVAPFWTAGGPAGAATTQTGGTQLLGDNNALLTAGGSISQTLLPLQVGQVYNFKIDLSVLVAVAAGDTIDIAITGSPLRQIQAGNVVSLVYADYSFDFVATVPTPTLTITNSTAIGSVQIDAVAVHLI